MSQAEVSASFGAVAHPYRPNSSGGFQLQPLSAKNMRAKIAERETDNAKPSHGRWRARLILGPGVTPEIADMYCAYAADLRVVEKIDYTDPRVGSFTQSGDVPEFVSGQPHGHVEDQPYFLLHPDHIQEGEDVLTLSYFPDEDAVRVYTAPIEHPLDVEIYDRGHPWR